MEPQKKYTIILADDDFDDAEFFESVLADVAPQIKFVHVEDGRDLLRLTQTLAPDVVFLDINMPRVDGWQCLKQLRESEAGNVYRYLCILHRLTPGISSYLRIWEHRDLSLSHLKLRCSVRY